MGSCGTMGHTSLHVGTLHSMFVTLHFVTLSLHYNTKADVCRRLWHFRSHFRFAASSSMIRAHFPPSPPSSTFSSPFFISLWVVWSTWLLQCLFSPTPCAPLSVLSTYQWLFDILMCRDTFIRISFLSRSEMRRHVLASLHWKAQEEWIAVLRK